MTVFSRCTMSHLAAELWLDSTPGWLAVVDGDSRYAMVERFRYEKNETYPGKASVIFWTNGPETRLNSEGEPSLTSGGDGSPRYLEAEINSPLVQLRPGETRDLDTEWFPTRAGSEFHGVEDAGIVVRPLQATRLENGRHSARRVPLEYFSRDVWSRTSTTNTAPAWELCL